jgi:hypothetical protein
MFLVGAVALCISMLGGTFGLTTGGWLERRSLAARQVYAELSMAGKRGAVEAARAPPRWPGRDDDDDDGVGDGRGVSLVQALSAARRETEAAGARMAAAVQQGQAAWRSGRRAEASEHRDVKLTASAEREAGAAAQVRLLLRLAGGGDTLDVHHAHVEPALEALRRWLPGALAAHGRVVVATGRGNNSAAAGPRIKPGVLRALSAEGLRCEEVCGGGALEVHH